MSEEKTFTRGALVQDILWVYQNLHLERPRAAPSPGARGLHEWVKDSPANMETFYKTMLARVMPREQELERIDKMGADAADQQIERVDELIDDFNQEEAAARVGAADPARQPQIPQESADGVPGQGDEETDPGGVPA